MLDDERKVDAKEQFNDILDNKLIDFIDDYDLEIDDAIIHLFRKFVGEYLKVR